MKFRIGDKVKFLHDTGGGEISSIIDKNQVMVRTEDGFDVPFVISDLVKYGETENRKLSGKEEDSADDEESTLEEIAPKEPDEPVEDEEIVFAVRLSRSGSDVLSYLVNSSSYNLYYTVSRNIEGEENLLANGTLESDTKVGLVKLIPSRMNETWKLRVNLIFWKHSFYTAVNPVVRSINLDFSNVFNGSLLKENDYFEQKAAIFTIYSFLEKEMEKFENKTVDRELLAAIAEKERKEEKKKAVKVQRTPDIEEVDLHIESLVDDHKDLTNGEIMEIQMARFKTSLETAIRHKTRRIVFIHGVGNGKLKHELRRSLERKYPDLKYQDASFKEYGYGATMVIIPQK